MAKKRRLNFFRLILVMVLIVLIALLLAFGISRLLLNESIDTPVDTPVNEKEKEQKINTLQIDLMDYEVYKSEKLDFGFVVAKIRFKDDHKINFDLNNAITNDNISLSKVSGYKRNVNEAGYSLSTYTFDETVISDENTLIVSLFVPYKLQNNALSINFNDKGNVEIDITKNIKDINSLINQQNEVVIKNDYEFEVTKPNGYLEYYFESGNTIENSSARKVYEFIVTIKNIKEGVSLIKATYLTSDGIKYEALPNEYTSYGNLNMIESQLKKGDSYCLLFKVPSSDTEPTSYTGELELVFSGSDEVIKLKADLN